ncbi:hypothetical protein L0222_23680 [bacterium]|nr:hypothetical protein [bacterium]
MMKYFALLCFLLVPLPGICISVEEVGRLAELQTAEDLILQIIQKEDIDRPLTTKDVIYLKERGLSERVIDYLWKQSFQDTEFLPPQEGESTMIGENLRSYNSTDKSGNKILVLTNLDENGRRMGPPPPPRPDPEAQPEPQLTYVPQQPKEIYVTVRHEEPAWASQEEDVRGYQAQPFGVGFPTYTNGYYPFYSLSYFPITPFLNPYCSSGKWSGHGHRSGGQWPHRPNVRGAVQRPVSVWKSARR